MEHQSKNGAPSEPNGGEAGRDVASEHVEAFVRLLGENQRRLFVYVMSLVLNRNDAEDILQETNLVLWREFEHFKLGTNFTAWACRIAYNQVLAWRKRQQREHLVFGDTFLEAIAEEISTSSERLDDRSVALTSCIGQLPPHHRQLLQLRYSEGHAVEAMAQGLSRTAEAVYRMLSRIRHTLHECVTRSLAEEGVS